MSTRLTPEMAASPQRETIMVSAMPTVVAKSCSTSSGPISRISSPVVKRGPPGRFKIVGLSAPAVCSMFLTPTACPAGQAVPSS